MVKFFLARIFAIAFLSLVGYTLKVKELLPFFLPAAAGFLFLKGCGNGFAAGIRGILRSRACGREKGIPAHD